MKTIRYIAEPNEHGIACDLTFRATTAAIEEPRQRTVTPDGILGAGVTRLPQWGTWEGTVVVDANEYDEPSAISRWRNHLLVVGAAPFR